MLLLALLRTTNKTLFNMGTLWLWEPEPLRALIFKGSDEDQVPIRMAGSGACEHREQLVLHTLESAFPEAGRAPLVERIELVSRIGLQIHLGGLNARGTCACRGDGVVDAQSRTVLLRTKLSPRASA